MAHDSNTEADEILDREFPVLDHGFVRLLDYMGSDESIVQAARVSYGKGTRKVSEDRALVRYLFRRRHTSPFEMVEFKFHIKLPVFVARQWIRHRTANVNEYSGRYSVMKEEFYLPAPDDVRCQAERNKQGRSEEDFPSELKRDFLEFLSDSYKRTYEEYEKLIDQGMARELARVCLPLSVYTEWYWKIDLHNLFHFLRLRLDRHAQLEIREYAKVMADIVKRVCPVAFEAFMDYTLEALCFSGPELRLLKGQLAGFTADVDSLMERGLSKRESEEFLDKLSHIKQL